MITRRTYYLLTLDPEQYLPVSLAFWFANRRYTIARPLVLCGLSKYWTVFGWQLLSARLQTSAGRIRDLVQLASQARMGNLALKSMSRPKCRSCEHHPDVSPRISLTLLFLLRPLIKYMSGVSVDHIVSTEYTVDLFTSPHFLAG
jgi:hypothetical protein